HFTQTKKGPPDGGPLKVVKLPVEPDRQLYLAGIVGRLDLTKLRVEVKTVNRVLADRIVVVGAIEQIVELAANREHAAFAEYFEAFLDGEIHVDVIRTDE